jgi:tetratricopeptide (TPR) repeat protein
VALLGVASAAGTSHADNALRPEKIPTKAKELATRGRIYHDAGDYQAAIAAFKEAYVLAPSPGLLFNIAQAYRLAGNCDEAAWMYRRFLDTNPTGPNKALAEQHLASVVKCGSGGLPTLVINPKVIAKVPDPKLVAKETSTSKSKPSPRGDKPDPNASITVAADETDHRGRTYKRIGIGLGVGAGAALVGAAVFALDSADASNNVSETYKKGGKWDDVKDIDARGKRSATLATALGIGGGVALASGVVLYGLGHRYEKAQHVAVGPTAHGAQVSLSWGF